MVVMEIRVFGFQFLAYYFIFYTLGYYLHKYSGGPIMKRVNTPRATIVLVVLWAFLAWGWTLHGLPSWMPTVPYVPSSLLQYAYRGFTAFVAMILLIGVAPKMLNGNNWLNQMFCVLGRVSLGLYVVHLNLIGYIVDGIQDIVPTIGTWFFVTIVFVVVLALSYSVVWLLGKNTFTA